MFYLRNMIENYMYRFLSLEELLAFVSRYNSFDNKSNTILNLLAMNENDLIRDYSTLDNPKLVRRCYIVYDEDYRIIDLRLFKNLLLDNSYLDTIKNQKSHKGYIFRKTPIPNTGKKSHLNNKIVYNKSFLFSELKCSLDTDMKEFIRKKRILKIKKDVFEDYESFVYKNFYKKKSKSWKKQKKRKQWM